MLNCGLTAWWFDCLSFVNFMFCLISVVDLKLEAWFTLGPLQGVQKMATLASARTKSDLHLDVPQIYYLIGFLALGLFFLNRGLNLAGYFFPLHFVALSISNLDVKFRWKSVPPALVSQDFLSLRSEEKDSYSPCKMPLVQSSSWWYLQLLWYLYVHRWLINGIIKIHNGNFAGFRMGSDFLFGWGIFWWPHIAVDVHPFFPSALGSLL